MATPAITIEQSINFIDLANILDIEIYPTQIPSCLCKNCTTGQMYIFQNLENGGYEYWCSNCNWSGTSIQVYQLYKNIQNISVATGCLANDLGLIIPSNALQDLILEFEEYVKDRQELNQVINRAKGLFQKDLPAKTTELLEGLGLWGLIKVAAKTSPSSQDLGVLTNYSFNDLARYINTNGLSRANFKSNGSIVMPLETMPGYIGAVLLMDSTRRKVIKTCTTSYKDGGIANLSSLYRAKRSRVYCLLDPIAYLSLKSKWELDNTKEAPFLYVPSVRRGLECPTTTTWRFIPDETEVVFWDYDYSVELINYARKLGSRGLIATKPELKSVAKDNLIDQTIYLNNLMSSWDRSAKHWSVVIGEWLNKMAVIEQQNFVRNLNPPLNQEELGLVEDSCDNWEKLKFCFAYQPYIETFKWNELTFIVRPNAGLYKVNNKSNTEELISDAYLVINEAVVMDSEIYLSGQIRYEDAVIDFIERESIIRKDPGAWVSKICMTNFGVPTIATKYRKFLLDIAFAYKKPEIKRAVEKIGYDPEAMKWIFPGFDIDNSGKVISRGNTSKLLLPMAEVPETIEFPGILALEEITKLTATNELFLSLYVCILANLLSARFGKRPRGILVINPSQTFHRVLTFVATTLNLTSFQNHKVDKDSVEKLAQLEHKYDVPVIIRNTDFDSKHWQAWMTYLGPRNCVVTPGIGDAINMFNFNDWFIIKANIDDDNKLDKEHLRVLNSLPGLLSRLEKNKLTIDTSLSIVGNSIRLLKDYLTNAGQLSTLNTRIFDRLLGLIHMNSTSYLDRVLFTIAYLEANQLLKLVDIDRDLAIVAMNTKNLYINWNKLNTLCNKHDLVIPDIEQVIENNRAEIVDKAVVVDRLLFEIQRNIYHSLMT